MNSLQRFTYVLPLIISFFLVTPQPISAEDMPSPATPHDYTILAGEWQRTDGGYLIKISDIQADGQVKAEYFNPSPIHVAQAAISTQETFIKLFIQFQDKGYEGSTYKLYYYAEKDALAGFYHQAVLDRTYEVIFARRSK